ncbi:aminotransferase [Microvirga sp. KLBC 81]|uniref:aminotransferase class V-fold PLP-dependent enzyme n=1 Tax=Microvirga sp. KLBC 81 TaxID=1862707 RepID=UPI000D50FA50|nr:aminotransferase class V-fold PLP-dependent enzyme [Microvirga sp. KLBC 81]PVE23816.1 aminotransferase [Microvirga sp. KLBC 81]
MTIDVARIRSETPGCSVVAHFNHSSCSLPPLQVTQTITEHLQREALYGPSEMGVAVADDVQATRQAAAQLLNASVEEIALTGSGSQGWGLAFASLPPLREGDRILIGRHEWGGNLSTMHRAAQKAGATVEVVPCRDDGCVSPEALASMLDDRVRLIALTWLPATNGLINPAAEIGRIARSAGVPYFIDAGQALAQVPVDVEAIGCDVLKGAGRKFLRGPRGTALLYVRRAFLKKLETPYLDVLSGPWKNGAPEPRDDARLFETGENSFALQLGLGTAIRYTLAIGVDVIRARINQLARDLRQRLSDIPAVTIHDGGQERSGIVAFTVRGLTPQEVRVSLAAEKINVAAIAAAYTPLDMAARGLTEIVRASVSYFTTEEEIERLVKAIAALAA